MKIPGYNPNRNTVKQTAEKAKRSRVKLTRRVLCRWCQVSRARRIGCEMVLHSTIRSRYRFTRAGTRLRTNWFWLIMNNSKCSRDRAWRRGGTIDVINAHPCHFFADCLSVFLFDFRPQKFTIGLYEEIYQITAFDFESCFPLRNLTSGLALYKRISLRQCTRECMPACVCVGGGGGGCVKKLTSFIGSTRKRGQLIPPCGPLSAGCWVWATVESTSGN